MLPRRIPDLLLIVLVCLDIVSTGSGQSGPLPPAPSDAQIPAFQLLRDPTGASRCEFCHRSEVEGYARSAMAHSSRRAGQEPDGTVTTPDSKITMCIRRQPAIGRNQESL